MTRSSVRMLRPRSSSLSGLMRIPMNGESVRAFIPFASFARDNGRVMILFAVGPVSVAVLEIDPEILDRLAIELFADSLVDHGERGVARDAKRAAERFSVRRILAHGAKSDCAELRDGIRREQLRTSVDSVHGLSTGPLTRMCARESQICFPKRDVRVGEHPSGLTCVSCGRSLSLPHELGKSRAALRPRRARGRVPRT